MSEKRKRPVGASTMVVNSVRATQAEWDAWQEAAKKLDMDRSEWIRFAMSVMTNNVLIGKIK